MGTIEICIRQIVKRSVYIFVYCSKGIYIKIRKRLQHFYRFSVFVRFPVIRIGLGESFKRNALPFCPGIIHIQRIGKSYTAFPVNEPDISIQYIPVRSLHHSLGFSVTHPDTITHHSVATFQKQIVFVCRSKTQGLVHPVGIHPSPHFLQTHIIFSFLLDTSQIPVRSPALIKSGKQFELQFFLGIHQIIIRQIGKSKIQVTGIIQSQLPGFGSLRFYHHDSIGRFRSIYSGSGRVFQHGNTLYPVHTQITDRRQSRLETVEDK